MMSNKHKNSSEQQGDMKKNDKADVKALNDRRNTAKDSQNKDKNAANAQINNGHYGKSK